MFSYEVTNHIATITKDIEVNVIRFGGGDPKLDIRRWFCAGANDEKKMGKGIALSAEAARRLKEILTDDLIASLEGNEE
ncbi:MAG: PC4/YdbC family ssDNA-binding protein [Bacillota bacterium]|jgi:hypothetical protein